MIQIKYAELEVFFPSFQNLVPTLPTMQLSNITGATLYSLYKL